MAVEVMQLASIIGKKQDIEKIIQKSYELNCFQPVHAGDVYENLGDEFKKIVNENPYKELFMRAKKILSQIGINTMETEIKNFNYSIEDIGEFVEALEKDVGALLNEKDNLRGEISEINKSIDSMEHFSSLDVELNQLFKVENFKVRFGRIPLESQEKLNLLSNPYVVLFQSSQDEQYKWGFYMTPHDQAEHIDKIFVNLFFERIRIPAFTGTPGEAVVGLKNELETAKIRFNEIENLIKEKTSSKTDKLKKATKWLWIQNESSLIKDYALCTERSFILSGWVPKAEYKKLENSLVSTFNVDVSAVSTASVDQLIPPTKLRNPKALQKYEMLIETFGLPNYKEYDPTLLVAVTYTVFFGIMFADVGQGLVLATVGFLIWKIKGAKIGRILIPCGIAGCIGGLFFGSIFGFEHAMDGFYELIGIEPFRALENEAKLLFMSIAAGTVVIALVIVLNIISSFKQKKYKSAILSENGITGLVFYVSVVMLAILTTNDVNVPIIAYISLLLVLPLLVIFFKDPILVSFNKKKRKEKIDWKNTFIMGPIEVFEMLLSFFSNTISFVRIGAFVLVHIGMMSAVFALADLFTGAAYVLVVILGNIFVIVLEGLLVGVQALRLEYYEMFSRFYKGDGKEFKPLNINNQTNLD